MRCQATTLKHNEMSLSPEINTELALKVKVKSQSQMLPKSNDLI